MRAGSMRTKILDHNVKTLVHSAIVGDRQMRHDLNR